MVDERRIQTPPKMSATLAINQRVRQLQELGEPVFHLGFGESRFPVHPRILAALRENATARTYLPVLGHSELRERVAAWYRRLFDLEVEAEQVVVGAGSKSLLYAVMQSLEGDVILPAPSWVTYATQARLAGRRVVWAPTEWDERMSLTAEGLRSAVARGRRAGLDPAMVVLCTPGNPTGTIYSADRLAELTEVAKEEGLLILSDEIYSLTAHDGVPPPCTAQHYPEGTIVTGGLSKHLSLGGWRLGVAVLPPGAVGDRLRGCVGSIAGSTWTTAASPVQHAAMVAYDDDPEIDGYIAACATAHGRLTGHLHATMTGLGVPCHLPSAAFYLYPSFAPWRQALRDERGVETSEQLATALFDDHQIATLPGSVFGADPGDLALRISTSSLMPMEGCARALELLASDPPNTDFVETVCPDMKEVDKRLAAFVDGLEKAQRKRA